MTALYYSHSFITAIHTIGQISNENEVFPVPTEIAKLSNLVVTTMGEEEHDDDDDDRHATDIPLSNVKSSVLAKVVDYCTHYKTEPSEYFDDHLVQHMHLQLQTINLTLIFSRHLYENI